MTRYALVPLLVVLCAPPLGAQSVQPASEPERPQFQDRRFDEDWSGLKDVDLSGRDHIWDRLKFIPFGEGEHVWLTLAGQARERGEYYEEFQFGDSQPAQSGGYLLSRGRFSTDLHATKYFRVFAEAKSSLASDRDLSGGDSTSFVDEFDLQNGFADVMIPLGRPGTLTLRGGRQELLFGSQRLVGPSDWTNVRRTFQGMSGIVNVGSWHVTPFWAELVVVDEEKFDKATPDNKLYGIYASGDATKTLKADLYWLSANNASTAFNGTSGHEKRQTLGGRLSRNAPAHPGFEVEAAGFAFEVEAAGQFGTLGADDIRASMVSVNGGYMFDARLKPSVFATMDFASGDGAVGGNVGTFNQLFPTNHTFLGTVDYVGRQNILSPSGGFTLRPMPRLLVEVSQFVFWRANVHDNFYDNSGNVARLGSDTTARYIGAETDLLATYQFDRHVLGYASYNHFFPGEFIRATGPARGSDYLYGALQFTF